MAWFRKRKKESHATPPGTDAGLTCPNCGKKTFTAVTKALPRKPGQQAHEDMGELVDESTGHCSECGLIAWGKVYASAGNQDERARRALLNNTLLLAWTQECRERHRRGEPTTKQHEVDFLSGARSAFGLEFDQLNHKKFVAICLENAGARLRKR
ncbi:MAG: hypothetical protein ACOY0T_11800 [Myxococcota bacterium]